MKNPPRIRAIRVLILLPIVTGLLCTSSTFASSEKQSVADIVQNFIHTAQGRQQTTRTTLGDSVLGSMKAFAYNIIAGSEESSRGGSTQYASANTNTSYIVDTYTPNTDIFFNDISDTLYLDDINILASQHLVAGYNDRFLPDNHIRLGGLSKVLINAYRITVGLDVSKATPAQFIQTAYNEGFLVGVIDTTSNIDSDMLINQDTFQTILTNIHDQYPKITDDIKVEESPQNYVTKAIMAHTVVALFSVPFNNNNYRKKMAAGFTNHPDRDAMMALIQHDIVPYNTNIDPDAYVSRATFINQLIKTYAVSNKVVLGENTYDVVDVDGKADTTPLVVYAYQQGRLDYMLIQTKGQTFLYPENKVTFDEVYEIITAMTQRNIVTGIIPYNEKITQGEVAAILVDTFGLKEISPEENISPRSSPNITIVQRVKNMFAKL